jgi:dihydrofolate synthase/folylpolyglutamate synthase
MSSGLHYFDSLQFAEGRRFSSLETARALLDALGNPQNRIPAVHVAGTNGKGSVCALLASMLFASGKRVGQTSSPHLSQVTERCLINGQPAQSERFGHAVETAFTVAQNLDLRPSYFVLGIAAAFFEFVRAEVDWMVIEAGLGGLLDATNLLAAPKATVISNISLDHTEVLGATIAEIARHKAGIAKTGCPLFVGPVNDEARLVIEAVARDLDVKPEFAGRDFFYDAESDMLICGTVRRPAFLDLLPFEGQYQRENAVLAVRTAQALGLADSAIRQGISAARWPGRLERCTTQRLSDGQTVEVLLDVAHNPGGMEALCDYLESKIREHRRRYIFVLSALERKDWKTAFGRLRNFDKHIGGTSDWIFTESGHPGAVAADELLRFVGRGQADSDAEQALRLAMEKADSHTVVVITGSVFLVGRVRPLLVREAFRTIAPPSEQIEAS